jgi:probable addiction module antidote protein
MNKKLKLKKISNYKNYDEWVADDLRQEKTGADEYIKIAFEEYFKDGDEKALLVMLRQAAKTKIGFKDLAAKTGLSRESLYRALSPQGNPRLHTIKLVLGALGYELKLQQLPAAQLDNHSGVRHRYSQLQHKAA